jgi:hypothetical protein
MAFLFLYSPSRYDSFLSKVMGEEGEGRGPGDTDRSRGKGKWAGGKLGRRGGVE